MDSEWLVQRRSSLHPVIPSSCHPFILSSLHLVILSLFLMACGGTVSEDVVADSPLRTPEPTAVAAQAVELIAERVQATPLPPNEALPPQQLRLPTLDLVIDVESMEWHFDPYEPEQTRWTVPPSGVGWHPNSVRAGATGNLLISGHQHEGKAPFVALALGRVTEGDLIELLDEENNLFIYEVITVSVPLPIKEMPPEVEAQVIEYVAHGPAARLTLITGWPEFTTTHRRFVVANLVEILDADRD